MKLIVRLRVGHYDWTDSEDSPMSSIIKAEKKVVIRIIKTKTGGKVDVADPTGHGGTSTTGPCYNKIV